MRSGRHYEHNPDLLTMEDRGIHVKKLNVKMNKFCKKKGHKFVGVSLFSPSYSEKAERLLRSCERNDVCCKATEIPKTMRSNAGDGESLEGTDEYRWQLIAMKPAFILSQLGAPTRDALAAKGRRARPTHFFGLRRG